MLQDNYGLKEHVAHGLYVQIDNQNYALEQCDYAPTADLFTSGLLLYDRSVSGRQTFLPSITFITIVPFVTFTHMLAYPLFYACVLPFSCFRVLVKSRRIVSIRRHCRSDIVDTSSHPFWAQEHVCTIECINTPVGESNSPHLLQSYPLCSLCLFAATSSNCSLSGFRFCLEILLASKSSKGVQLSPLEIGVWHLGGGR